MSLTEPNFPAANKYKKTRFNPPKTAPAGIPAGAVRFESAVSEFDELSRTAKPSYLRQFEITSVTNRLEIE
jgi:hypothetical protein